MIKKRNIKFLRIGIIGDEKNKNVIDKLVENLGKGLGKVLIVNNIKKMIEDKIEMIVNKIVIFEKVIEDLKVERIEIFMRILKRIVDKGVEDGLVLIEEEFMKNEVNEVGKEDENKIVMKRKEEF